MTTAIDYQDAISVQSACNLSGVVRAFSEVVSKIWEDARASGQGTKYVNTHPISKMYAAKIADLARVTDTSAYMQAYQECESKAK